VHFAGRQQGEQLARTLNAHRHVVVPSMWDEPFGLVALEALACGCRALVADCGGLREAAGPNAIAFAKGDAAELALRLEGCIDHGAGTAARCADAEASMLRHLERHRPAAVAERYLEIFARVLEQRRAWT